LKQHVTADSEAIHRSVDRVVGNPVEHVAQVRAGVQAIELGRADQAVHRGGTLPSSI
jgi:hypothetical protein